MNKPQVGMIVEVYGHKCRIYKMHPFGTMDVENVANGKCYRLSGLNYEWAMNDAAQESA